MQRSPKHPCGTNFGFQKSLREGAQKASAIISKTFQASQRLQRTKAGPSNRTVQNKPNNMSFCLFNT